MAALYEGTWNSNDYYNIVGTWTEDIYGSFPEFLGSDLTITAQSLSAPGVTVLSITDLIRTDLLYDNDF